MKKMIPVLALILIMICESSPVQQDSLWSFNYYVEYALGRNIQVRRGELTNQRYWLYIRTVKSEPPAFTECLIESELYLE